MKSFIFYREWLMLYVAWLLAGLAGCNLPASQQETPTIDVTQAYQTVQARLTESIALTPEATTTLAQDDLATNTPAPGSPTPGPSLTPTVLGNTGPAKSVLCDQAAPGVPIDVTIPDDTKMQPDQVFTKIWRLQNAGTCTWTKEYALVWFSGERLGAPASVSLSGNVAPGQTVDLAVDMEAPGGPGTYQSNWKLRNSAGVLFGIGPSGGSPFWVRIVVVKPPTLTPSPTIPVTATPTSTPTTPPQVSGPANLAPGDLLDLDANQINSGGEDLAYQTNDAKHVLAPKSPAVLVVFGSNQPGLLDCQNAPLSPNPVVVEESLVVGTYLCYRTNMALPGRARVTGFDPGSGTLNLEIYTWAIP